MQPLADAVGAKIFAPLDDPAGEPEALMDRIKKEWGEPDIVVHLIASAKKEDIKGKLIDCSADGFAFAMDVGALLHPHGEVCGAVDEERRHDVRDELPRRPGGAEL